MLYSGAENHSDARSLISCRSVGKLQFNIDRSISNTSNANSPDWLGYQKHFCDVQAPSLLTWINFIPSMDS